MSPARHKRAAAALRDQAPVFAALGDETRLRLVETLSRAGTLSISQLTRESAVTRQAVSKHLRVLEDARLVRSARLGRERLFRLAPRRLGDAQRALDRISRQWDEALDRLRAFVEG